MAQLGALGDLVLALSADTASAAGGFAVLSLSRQRPESSTELRRRLVAGEPWQDWVPPPVAAYIGQHRLYAARPWPPAPL